MSATRGFYLGTGLLIASLSACKPEPIDNTILTDMAGSLPPDGMPPGGADLRMSDPDLTMPDLAMPDMRIMPPAWGQTMPRARPSQRSRHGMAFDSARNRVVLFGGYLQPNPPNYFPTDETWEWDGSTWEKKEPLKRPPPRVQFGMAFDSTRKRVIIFGGATDPGELNDTWAWNGTSWEELTPTTRPSVRSTMPMAYDAKRDRVVLFGGCSPGCASSLRDTWEFDGSDWKQVQMMSLPPARRGHGLAYDPAGERTLLFGGRATGGPPYLDDTWQWNGTQWQQLSPTARPPAVNYGELVMDTQRRRAVMVGRDGGPMEVWELDGNTWIKITPVPSPPRDLWGIAYDSLRGEVVLFGGLSGSGFLDDTWIYR